ncbi:MAG: indole-3-glycerol phosphate synthase TrpC [Odoribacteraceae bacterium]|jgi:indole-3-glycerol phosphate synthase|nr:indole-3-glycerol phosphate synthase TrpC [Odoribacteraceae bacterium]
MNTPTKNILESICIHKWNEVARQKEELPLSRLERAIRLQERPVISLKRALTASSSGIIAEFKRRSPSKGWIAPGADAASVATAYERAGAAAISCLTDEHFFGGGFSDFERARAAVSRVPLLRKDFIVDEYQLFQSRVMGADVVLLIAACLTREDARHLSALAHRLGMEVLLELHDETGLDYIQPDTDLVGINNRDLKTFSTDPSNALALARALPPGPVKIAESGITSPVTVQALRAGGFQGFLVGEHFMRSPDPGKTLEEFITRVNEP